MGMIIASFLAACVFIQVNRMLDAEARERAAKRQARDAERQAPALGK